MYNKVKDFIVVLDIICLTTGRLRSRHTDKWTKASQMNFEFSTVIKCNSTTIYNDIDNWLQSCTQESVNKRLTAGSPEFEYQVNSSDVTIHYEMFQVNEI